MLFKFLKVSYVLPNKVSGGHKYYIFALLKPSFLECK